MLYNICMALLTSLTRVKAITQGDSFVQGLSAGDDIVTQTLDYVTIRVQENPFGTRQREAQDFLAAHYLSSAGQASGGQGPLSSEAIGRIATSFTLPYLNRKQQEGMTQYGTKFLDIVDQVAAAFLTIVPS